MRGSPWPLVSCVMPTADRRQFVPHAIANFLAQVYPNKELVILDDGLDSVADLIPVSKSIIYHRVPDREKYGKLMLGLKRNLVNALASGEIIAHWDDDDWRSSTWLNSQVYQLQQSEADICGLNKMLHYQPLTRDAWLFKWHGPGVWLAGGSLCYWKSVWERIKFPPVNDSEETAFVRHHSVKNITISQHLSDYVAIAHPHNTVPRHFGDNCNFSLYPTDLVEDILAGSWVLPSGK